MSQRPDDSIAAKCFHPSGKFTPFPLADVETSVAERFEKAARRYPDRIAVKTGARAESYEQLNKAANRLARAPAATGRAPAANRIIFPPRRRIHHSDARRIESRPVLRAVGSRLFHSKEPLHSR